MDAALAIVIELSRIVGRDALIYTTLVPPVALATGCPDPERVCNAAWSPSCNGWGSGTEDCDACYNYCVDICVDAAAEPNCESPLFAIDCAECCDDRYQECIGG